VLSLLLTSIVGALAVLTVVPRAVDGAALTVLTGSMTPEIAVGSVVVVQPVDPGTLRVGDVVTYQKTAGKDDYVTHRITTIDTTTEPITLRTKGDANRGEDLQPVPVTAVRGKVLFSVPYLGALRNTIGVRGSGLVLVALALAAYAMAQLVSALRDRRRQPMPAAVQALHAADTSGTLSLQTLVMTLPVETFEGLSPAVVARLLRMDLVDQSAGRFTVTVTRETEQLDELVELLDRFEPHHSARSGVITVPVCASSDDAPARPEDEEAPRAAA
jgi:signal peptidase I